MFLKKYELFLQNLNQELTSGNLDIQKNEEKLQKVLTIYKLLQEKKYTQVKELIKDLWFEDETPEKKKSTISPGCAPAMPAPVPQKSSSSISQSVGSFFGFARKKEVFQEKQECSEWESACEEAEASLDSLGAIRMENTFRDWDIQSVHDEDNIEAFNSIEMMSAIFLKNLQEKIWTQK